MSLDFKTETARSMGRLRGALYPLICWLSMGLSLIGFSLILHAIKAIHPPKPVEIACEKSIKERLDESAVELERVRGQIIQQKK